ncbi:hypothetical protein [Herbidospora daliensis]|uniref:hypothetical protein n=1 Tax=Herbidospora daliensis TaxID=295585 RepID=UPI001E35EF95|nr:hypothetical protein [Herbidospora daliensis]
MGVHRAPGQGRSEGRVARPRYTARLWRIRALRIDLSPGRLLAVGSVLPALALSGWLLAGLLLVFLGWFGIWQLVVLGVPAAALFVWAGWPKDTVEATWWQAGAVFLVAVASGVFNTVYASQQYIVRRDPATYQQYAIWLRDHGGLPIPFDLAAFGGPDDALRFASMGFYAHDGAIVPQFMPGAPILYASGFTPALLGALAVLTVGGVTARLVHARFAWIGALAFAIAMPILYTSRTTFSEIPSLVLLFGGIALVLAGRRMFTAGLVFGLALLIRIDGLRDILPVLVFGVVAQRRLLAGVVAGGGIGFGAGIALSRPYFDYLSGSLLPLLAICAAVLVVAPFVRRVPRWLPNAAAAGVVLAVLAFALRPLVETVKRPVTNPEDELTAQMIGAVQKANGLPIDPTRLYYEDSLYWVIWYVGLPALLLAVFGAVTLMRRMEKPWLLPTAIILWTTATTLYRPAITADHPFAARRLVPVIIPGLILLAVWGARKLPVWATAALLVVPPVITSIGTAFTPIERGERAAVQKMCDAIPDGSTVLIVERVTGDRLTQVVRGQCGFPTARVAYPDGADVPDEADVRRIIAKTHDPVLLAAEPGQLTAYGTPRQVMGLRTRQDERSLVEAPDGTWSLSVDVWLAVP